jgi:AcrR family transcriptional regulator
MVQGRRDQLLDHGIELALRQRLQDLLASVETRTITEGVGVTTGSFFHHFRSRARFAEAVADRYAELWQERVERWVELSLKVGEDPSAAVVREGAETVVEDTLNETDRAALQALLWVGRDQPVADDTTRTGGDVLRAGYCSLFEALVPVFEHNVAAMGREMLPPFTHHDLAVLSNVLAEGFERVTLACPEAVRDGLYADLISVNLIALTRPRTERADRQPVELATLESRLVSGPRTTRGSGRPVETWRHIADAAAPAVRRPQPRRGARGRGGRGRRREHQHRVPPASAASPPWPRRVGPASSPSCRPSPRCRSPPRRARCCASSRCSPATCSWPRRTAGATEALVAEVINEVGPDRRPGGPVHPLGRAPSPGPGAGPRARAAGAGPAAPAHRHRAPRPLADPPR